MILSVPFNINNVGFYDISNFNLTTKVESSQGISISNSSTFVPLIPKGENVSITYNIALNFSNMLSKGLSYMLFNDSTLNVDVSVKVEYAKFIPLQISFNRSMPWGAPLYNLTVENPTIEGVDLIIPISFDNHSLYALNGTMTLELLDDSNQLVSTGTTDLNVQPQSSYNSPVRVQISGDPSRIREALLSFDTSVFSYGPVVFSIV
jgi:hypothetical protein